MTILRETRIVMPMAVHVHEHHRIHEAMAARLIETYGGYTSYVGRGGWLDDGAPNTEHVVIYDIAIDSTQNHWAKLRQIALDTGRALRQKAVYIRFADGGVEIIPCHTPGVPLNQSSSTPGAIGAVGTEPQKPAGQKRLPQPGEVWRMRGGGKAAVMSSSGKPNVYPLNCVVLDGTQGGECFKTDNNGLELGPHHVSQRDLIAYHTQF